MGIALRQSEFGPRFTGVRDHFAVHLTDHQFRVVAQAYPSEEEPDLFKVLCLPTSESGRALIKAKIAVPILHHKLDENGDLTLTVLGAAIHRYLADYADIYFGPDSLLNRFMIWWNGRALAKAKLALPAPAPVVKPAVLWSEADEKHQTALWQQGISAFWLCPDGIDEGLRVLDEFDRTGKLPAKAIPPVVDTVSEEICRRVCKGETVPQIAKAVSRSQEFVAKVWQDRHGVRLPTYTAAQTFNEIVSLHAVGMSVSEIALKMARTEKFVVGAVRKHAEIIARKVAEAKIEQEATELIARKIARAKSDASRVVDARNAIFGGEVLRKHYEADRIRKSYYTSSTVPAKRDIGLKPKAQVGGGNYLDAVKMMNAKARLNDD